MDESSRNSSRRRRGHNEGSIFQRKDGRWVARVDLGYQNGRRQRKDIFGRTRPEVQRKLAAAQRAIQDNLPIPAERQRFGAFLTAWLQDVARPTYDPRIRSLPRVADASRDSHARRRRSVGYDRYNSQVAFQTLERLYPLFRLQLNFLRPDEIGQSAGHPSPWR